MEMMMMEKPRTKIITESNREYEEQDQNKIRGENFFHVLQKIRENDIHFGEHEMTLSLWSDPRNRRTPSSCRLPPPRIGAISAKMISEQDLIGKKYALKI